MARDPAAIGRAVDAAPRHAERDGPRSRWFAPAVAGAHFLLVLMLVAHHVMWRDELRPWQIIKECSSVSEVVSAMRYDGVPLLWNMIIFGLTRVSGNPIAMQIAHAVIASAVVYVVARWSPFGRMFTVVFAIGYFPLFEYGVIARNYSLVFLFIMSACVLIARPRINLLMLSAVLFLLTQTSIWGAGLAVVILLTGIVKAMRSHPPLQRPFGQMLTASLIVTAGLIACYVAIQPGPGREFATFARRIPTVDQISRALATIHRGLLPIPAISIHFWNTSLLDAFPFLQGALGAVLLVVAADLVRRSPIAAALLCVGSAGLIGYAAFYPFWGPHLLDPVACLRGALGASLLVLAAILVRRSPVALTLLCAGSAGLIAFACVFPGFSRHHGHLFILFLAACWLAQSESANERRGPGGRPSASRLDTVRGQFLMVLLVVHALVGVSVAAVTLVVPFTASRAVAGYIQANFDGRVMLAGIPDYCVSPISEWVDQPIYSPQMRQFARVNTQDGAQRYPIDAGAFLPEIHDLILHRQRDVVFIAEAETFLVEADGIIPLEPDHDGRERALEVKALPEFHDCIERSEAARLYLIRIAR